MITTDQLIKMGASPSNSQKYVNPLNNTCIKYSINTDARISSFLSQVYEESGCLSFTKENLYYSTKRLMEVWPSRFPNLQSTVGFANNPSALAEKVYGGRGDNPIGKAGLYIGRGLIQLTFYKNYKALSEALHIDLTTQPELLEQPEYAALCAGWYWNEARCNIEADKDILDAVKIITKKINGGYNNLNNRQQLWLKAKKLSFNLDEIAPQRIIEPKIEPLPNVVLPNEHINTVMQNYSTVQKPSLFSSILSLFTKSN